MNQFKNLLSPLRVGPTSIRNRILVSAHVPGFAEDNKAGKKYIDYHRQYAKGGVGLQITGGTPIHESGLLSTSSDGLWNLDDSVIPGYQSLASAVHDEGGRILAQLAHSGGTTQIDKPGWVSWSCSPIRSETTGNVSHEMTRSQIREVIRAYAQGALRAKKGGMDGIELLAAFGFLPQAFLSPLTNWRTDEYGGSLVNRMRFLIELLSEIRNTIGQQSILGLRIPGDEFEPGGLSQTDMKIICQQLANLELVDYFNVIAHTNITIAGRSRHWAPSPAPHGLFVDLASGIREVVNVPVFAAGRIVDPIHAEQIISMGKADMVAMTRAHICDPKLVEKIVNDQISRIRPCVGANTCIANRYIGKPIRCMHNAEIGTSDTISKKATNPRDIVIIGAGPAGLEAARICAQKGHRVRIFDSQPQVGGQLALWSKSPSTKELRKIIDWRLNELSRFKTEIILGTPVTSDMLYDLSADVIIEATGSNPITQKYDNASIPIMTPHQLLESHPRSPLRQISNKTLQKAIVISDGKGQAGLVAAEVLTHMGVAVQLVTSDFAIAADLDPTQRNGWYERLGKQGVTLHSQLKTKEIRDDQIDLENVFSDQTEVRKGISLIVNWQGSRMNDTLFHGRVALNGSSTQETLQRYQLHSPPEALVNIPPRTHCFSIGDCVSPRTVAMAITQAVEISKRIDAL